ncbi:MAG: TIGR03013 family PEP-CTERM/XrtA system glycosyltransferase [Alphaproteobacteria bacterium]|nr:TIGR03013 family PEP-CTERM/XrtA system glycosyltransferase [Alphaproteobacteria bacterium]
MLRIFGHFVPIPAIVIGLCEILLISAAIYLATAPDNPALAGEFHFTASSIRFSLGMSAVATGVMGAVGLYNYDVFLDSRLMMTKALLALAMVVPAAAIGGLFFTSNMLGGIADSWHALAFKSAAAWMGCVVVTRMALLRFSDVEMFRRGVVVLGTGVRAARIADLARRRANHYFVPRAYVHIGADPHLVASESLDLDAIKDSRALAKFARTLGVREVVVATDERRGMPIEQLLHCKIEGVNVVDYLTFWERENGRIDIDALQPSWLIYSDGFRQGRIVNLAKRAFDLTVSFMLLAAALPVIALTALAIRLESPGSVLYRQERVGYHNRTFMLYKFRSMRTDAERDGAPRWATNGDPRITRVGAIIRRFRIDELPQLWNVFKGNMSFVGPRPERPFFVEQLAEQIAFYDERHSVKPGITGWAQVNYSYGASLEDARQKLAYDLYYVKNRTLFLDIVILIQTVRVILFREGAR